jgi:glycyl-tRNA synthetase beta chain (EC 6.1.1.14)
VANIESKDPVQIISGNEKVVRPRLADAEFFFNTDRKNAWKTTCHAYRPYCSSNSWVRCVTKPTVLQSCPAGLLVKSVPM